MSVLSAGRFRPEPAGYRQALHGAGGNGDHDGACSGDRRAASCTKKECASWGVPDEQEGVRSRYRDGRSHSHRPSA